MKANPRRSALEASASGASRTASAPPSEAQEPTVAAQGASDALPEGQDASNPSEDEVSRAGPASTHPAPSQPSDGSLEATIGSGQSLKRARTPLVWSPRQRRTQDHEGDASSGPDGTTGSEEEEEAEDASRDDDARSWATSAASSRAPDPSDTPAVKAFLGGLPHGPFGSVLSKDDRRALLRRYAMPRAIAGKAPALNADLHAAFDALGTAVDQRADGRRVAAFEQQRQILSPLLAAMAAVAAEDLAAAHAAIADATSLAVANVAATVVERREALLAPLGPGYSQLATTPQLCGPGDNIFSQAKLSRAINQQSKLIASVTQAFTIGKRGDRRGPGPAYRGRGGPPRYAPRTPYHARTFRADGRRGDRSDARDDRRDDRDRRGDRDRDRSRDRDTGGGRFFRQGPGGSRGASNGSSNNSRPADRR